VAGFERVRVAAARASDSAVRCRSKWATSKYFMDDGGARGSPNVAWVCGRALRQEP
jgi:hypothetical protein